MDRNYDVIIFYLKIIIFKEVNPKNFNHVD